MVERKPVKFNVVGSSPTLFRLTLEHFLQIKNGALVQLVVMPLCHGFEPRTYRKISMVKSILTSLVYKRKFVLIGFLGYNLGL